MTTISLSSNTAWSLYNYRRELIEEVIRRGFRVVVMVPSEDKVPSRADASSRLAAMGCEIENLPIDSNGTHPLRDFSTLLSYRAAYRRIRPDVALHYTIKPVIYGTLAAAALNIPCINLISGSGTAFSSRNLVSCVVGWLYRLSQRGAKKVFFLNRQDRDQFVRQGLIAVDKVELLPGEGINLDDFPFEVPDPKPRDAVFLLMARMLWDKGIAQFVDAARALKASYPGAKFRLLGPIEDGKPGAVPRSAFEAWAKEGVVEYLGETQDVRPFIRDADCIVLPSYYREGLPRSLLEASAMGRIVITTDSVGCREVVEDGVNGYLCLPRDVESLIEKMKTVLELPAHLRADMGRRGRAKMEREFDIALVIGRYLDTLEGTLDESTRFASA